MIDNIKALKRLTVYIIVCMVLVVVVACWVMIPYVCQVYATDDGKVTTPPNDVIKTVAHLEEAPEGYELMYADTEHDVAYYRLKTPKRLLLESYSVKLNGENYKVISTDDYGFELKCTGAEQPGWSGKPVYHSSEVVGYVSELRNSETIYCIWN